MAKSSRALLVGLVLACGHSSTTTDDEPTPPTLETTANPSGDAAGDDSATSVTPSPSTNDWAWPTAATTPPKLTSKPAEAGRPKGDRSRAFPSWETSWVGVGAPDDPPEGETHGKVAEIRAAVGETPGVLRIEAADGRALELPLRGSGQLALAVGDAVAAKWRTSQSQIHTVHDLAILDGKGGVVYASSGNGDETFAPGWYFEQKGIADRGNPHMRGGARSESRWLVIAKGDVAAFVKQSEGARRLSTPDGDFAVSGSAITWSKGKLPPDSSSYSTFGIVRLR
jgi:hypothetical protein